MNIDRLEQIIRDSLAEEAVDPANVPEHIAVIDVHFLRVGFSRAKALSHRDEFVKLLEEWPAVSWGVATHRLDEGPSYIEFGGVVGDQRRALILMALGEAMELWRVVTPATLGITGESAASLAGQGMVMIDGYRPKPREVATS